MSVSVPAKNPELLHMHVLLRSKREITDSVIKKKMLKLKLKLQK